MPVVSPSRDVSNLVARIYQDVLGRAPDPAGASLFATSLNAGLTPEEVRRSIAASSEARQLIGGVYLQELERPADPGGLTQLTTALGLGYTLDQVRKDLATSPESTGNLSRAYERAFGTGPTAFTLSVLQTELSLGRPLAEVEKVDAFYPPGGSRFNYWGYVIPAAFSSSGQLQFLQIAAEDFSNFVAQSNTTSISPTGPSNFAPGSDTITLDLQKIGNLDQSFTATLDGKRLGGATVSAAFINPNVQAQNEVTFTGNFGPGLHMPGSGLHTLHLALTDPAQSDLVVRSARLDFATFLLGKATIGAIGAGTLDLFLHSLEPQPPSNVFHTPNLPPLLLDPSRAGPDLVARIYEEVLGRAADPAAASLFAGLLDAGLTPEEVRGSLATSIEAQLLIQGLYTQLLGRPADPDGLLQFTAALRSGDTLSQVRANIASSSEAQQRVGEFYEQALGRTADPGGLSQYAAVLGSSSTLAEVHRNLATSPESTGNLSRSYEGAFGKRPSVFTLSVLQTELSLGRPLAQVEKISGINVGNHLPIHLGYGIPAAYSLTGTTEFFDIASADSKLDFFHVSTTPVLPIGPSDFAPGPDTIVLDLAKITMGGPAQSFTATLDGKRLGGATVSATFNYPIQEQNEVTFTGNFGPGLHTLHLALTDPAQSSLAVRSASFDGNAFLLGGATIIIGEGALDLFSHPGPQSPVEMFTHPYHYNSLTPGS